MKNIFLLSGDLTHKGHVNTLVTATKELDSPVHGILCNNEIKSNALFTLEQRKKDFILTLLANENFQKLNIDPYQIVHTAENKGEIVDKINQSEKVVRGIRNNEDIIYIEKLLEVYKIKNGGEKGHYINVPDEFKHISSSKHKFVLQSFLNEYDQLPKPYTSFISQSDFLRFKSMPLVINYVDEETISLFLDDYLNYFERLEKINL